MHAMKMRSLFLAASLAVGAVVPAIAATKAPGKNTPGAAPTSLPVKKATARPADDNVVEIAEAEADAAPAAGPGFNLSASRALVNLAKDDMAQDNPALQASYATKASALLKQGADPAYNDGEAFCYAAKNGQLGLLKVLVEEGRINLNIRNGQALLMSAMRGRNEVIGYLLDKGMDPDGFEKIGRPLAQAAGNSHLSTIELFKQRGADINIHDGYPLAIASILGSLDGVKKLVEMKVDINAGLGLALRSALDGGSVEVTKYLLEQGADPTLIGVTYSLETMRKEPEKYNKPEHKEIAALLIKARENRPVTAPKENPATPSASAAMAATAIVPPTVQAISKAAAEQALSQSKEAAAKKPKVGIEKYEGQLQYDDDDGYKLAGEAQQNNLERMKELLAKKSADPNFLEGLPMQAAAGVGFIEGMKLLLDNGADINIDDGLTMMFAADSAQVEAVQFLIDRGIDLFSENIELYLEQIQVVKADPNYAATKYAKPAYADIVSMINSARKAKDSDYIPKVYEAIRLENGLFKSQVKPKAP
ncbi:MAG: Pfs, and Ankyrin domain protein [Micavibrio sp.]|nr:Pfs, and Ankyrin domain protein [Micavibrio sp.]